MMAAKQGNLNERMKELKAQEAEALAALEAIREQMAQVEDAQWAVKARTIAGLMGDGFDEFYKSVTSATKAEAGLLRPHLEAAVDAWATEVAERRMGKVHTGTKPDKEGGA